MAKYYAVKRGKKEGIYTSWSECKKQVDGFSNAIYKSFSTYDEAKAFIGLKSGNESLNNVKREQESDVIAYIDGSYDDGRKLFSYAGIIFMKNNERIEFSIADSDETLIDFRNVAGEIKASMYAIDLALENNAKSIDIYYDYAGIENWANKSWKANNFFTKKYVKYIEAVKFKIDIYFKKVKSHSGNKYNDEVDLLAKRAIDNYKKDSNTQVGSKKYDNMFSNLKATKRTVNLNVIIENKIYDSTVIYNIFKNQWRAKGNKIKDILELKTILDMNEGKVLVKVSTEENEEILVLDLGGINIDG